MLLATTWLGLHILDWIVLLAYLLGVTAIGVWSYKKVKDMSDFFMGGRRFGKVFMMFFAFGSGTSSEQAVSVAAGSFRNGLAGIWFQFLWIFSTPFYWIIAPVFRRMRALTTSDFFEARYGTSTAALYSVLGILMSITFISGSLFGGAKMVEGLSGGEFKPGYAVAVMTVMFVVYGMAGGLGAAVVTDFIQGVLTIIFSFLLLPFALWYAADVAGVSSGFAALHQGVPGRTGDQITALFTGADITPFFVLMLSLTGLVGIVVQPHIMGVCGAGKTEFEGRFGFTVGNFLKRICTVAWAFTGMAAIIIYLTPENGYISASKLAEINADPIEMHKFADGVFGLAAHDILPTISHGLVGLLFAALLAAIMSTCDAQMVVGSGLFTENIYKRFIKKDGDPRHYLWVGRFASLGIVCLALLMMTQFTNVIQVLTRYIQPIPTFMGLAFWFGITWRRYTTAGVWASTLATAATWYFTQNHTPFAILASLGDSPILQKNIDYLPSLCRGLLADVLPFMTQTDAAGNVVTKVPWQIVLYLTAGAVTGVVVSLLTRRAPQEKLDHFFTLIRTPVKPGEKVDTPCTLPEDHLPAETGKLIQHPDIEIPRPTAIGMGGFLGAWVLVGVIILLTMFLAGLGS